MSTKHIDAIGELTDEAVIDWYEKCQPTGSGPLAVLRMLCIALEDIARQRGIDLPPAKGVRPRAPATHSGAGSA